MKVIVTAKEPEIYIMPDCRQKIGLYSKLSAKKGKDFYLVGYTMYDDKEPSILYIYDMEIIPQKVTYGKPTVNKEVYKGYFGQTGLSDDMTICSNVFCYCNSTKNYSSKNFSEYERKNILIDTNVENTMDCRYFISIYCNADGSVKYNCYDIISDVIYEDYDVDFYLEPFYTEEEIEKNYKDNITEGYTPSYNGCTNYCGNTVNTNCSTYNYNNTKTVKKERVKSELVKKSPDIMDLV